MNAVKVYFTSNNIRFFSVYVNDFQCIVTICNLFYIFWLLQIIKKTPRRVSFFVKL